MLQSAKEEFKLDIVYRFRRYRIKLQSAKEEFKPGLFAQSSIEGEFRSFADTLRNILVGPVAKTLAVGCFIGAGIFFMLGKIGIAIGCIVGGIFLGFAERIAEAVFR